MSAAFRRRSSAALCRAGSILFSGDSGCASALWSRSTAVSPCCDERGPTLLFGLGTQRFENLGHETRIFSSSCRSTAPLSRSECEPASVVQSERSPHLSFLLSSCHCRAMDGESSFAPPTLWDVPASLNVPTHMEDAGIPMSLAAFMK